jgi:SecD/SecF fusion protein
MSFADLPLFFAQTTAEAAARTGSTPFEGALLTLGILVAPFVLGYLLANALKLPDYGWKLGLILFTIIASAAQIGLRWPPALGVDLKGGVILVYEIDEEQTVGQVQATGAPDAGKVNMSELATAIGSRLNPTGLKETVVRPYGEKQIEIVVPNIDEKEIERVKFMMTNPGLLEFMIVVDNPTKDGDIIQAARDQAANLLKARSKFVEDDKGVQIGYWALLAREKIPDKTGQHPFRVTPNRSNLLRLPTTGEILEWKDIPSDMSLEAWLSSKKIDNVEILMRVDEDYRVRGSDLSFASAGRDQNLSPDIEFGFSGDGIGRMSQLTGNNLPDQSGSRQLGIVFDGALISAPTIQGHISDRGQITGRFTQAEVDNYVALLKEGKLPAVLKKTPVSENQIGSLLGRDTIQKGSYSLLASVIIVLGFILVYYQFAGFVACVALILNVALTVAIMMLFKAPFTMPGLAGLVLTVGMSVDANVLIYERMREEFAKGSGFRLALRNGFDRAMVTIIDSNLTTLLTGIVLYFIGTDQIRGFAVTLVLGILTSMYTAIFFARVIFEVAERTGMIRSLHFFEFFHSPNVDFVRLFKPALVVSTIVIGIGLVATVSRGRSLFDIDLAGGTSVTMQLSRPEDDVELRKLVDEALAAHKDERNSKVDYSLHEVAVTGEERKTVYRLDTSLQDVEKLKAILTESFGPGTEHSLLRNYKLEVGEISSRAAGAATTTASAIQAAEGKAEMASPSTVDANQKTESGSQPEKSNATQDKEKDSDTEEEKKGPAANDASAREAANVIQLVALQSDEAAEEKIDGKENAREDASAEKADNTTKKDASAVAKEADSTEKAKEEQTEEIPAEAKPAVTPTEPGTDSTAPKGTASSTITTVRLSFPGAKIGEEALVDRFRKAAQEKFDETPDVRAVPVEGEGPSEEWTLETQMDEARTREVISAMKTSLEASPVWQSSSKIGGQVAIDMQLKAVFAVLLSLVGIALYVWFRFHKLSWGIAAIASLVHDTLVMLAAIGASYYVADALRPLLLEEFKISLTVIAAFLTLIGYSINDTIVIFDRIREIRGKDPALTAKMINDSLNQTLSRTILTSGTVFATVIILYIWGGPGIHTFAFAMVVGVISGTYSTVFIAAPMLLWLLGAGKDRDSFLSA